MVISIRTCSGLCVIGAWAFLGCARPEDLAARVHRTGDCGAVAVDGPTVISSGADLTYSVLVENRSEFQVTCRTTMTLEGPASEPPQVLTTYQEAMPRGAQAERSQTLDDTETLTPETSYRLIACSQSLGESTEYPSSARSDEDPSNDCAEHVFEVRERNDGDCGITSITTPEVVVLGSGQEVEIQQTNHSTFQTACVLKVGLYQVYDTGYLGDLGLGFGGTGFPQPGVTITDHYAYDTYPFLNERIREHVGQRLQWEACGYSLGGFLPEERDGFTVDEDESNRCGYAAFTVQAAP